MSDLVKELQLARAECRVANIAPSDLPRALQEAYPVALNMLPDTAAWKIGGANSWSQKVFANSKVFFGPLAPKEVFIDTQTIDIQGLFAPLAEPEIVLEIGDATAPDIDQRFLRMGLGIEIPASVLPGNCKAILTGQIVDRAGAGALWIGALRPFDATRLRLPFSSEFRHNLNAPITGKGDNILGGPLGAATDFLAQAHSYGAPLHRGQWVATGGLSPATAIAPGDRLRFSALGSTIAVDIVAPR